VAPQARSKTTAIRDKAKALESLIAKGCHESLGATIPGSADSNARLALLVQFFDSPTGDDPGRGRRRACASRPPHAACDRAGAPVSSSTLVHSGPVLGPPCPRPGLSPGSRTRISSSSVRRRRHRPDAVLWGGRYFRVLPNLRAADTPFSLACFFTRSRSA
jgi:hypothetical protein